ncbi:hypothetical protein A0H81_09643 [Grifola frondosa]|uniref:GP-PDE domain-containing protein n=1 Tax=Grifola frondosa TaxID=5627 RepID=A0A1C7M0B4_GRIFR|nr:hypothetical protein A0H81_09643 [Grifola frondosa]
MSALKSFPECWGHRGASAAFRRIRLQASKLLFAMELGNRKRRPCLCRQCGYNVPRSHLGEDYEWDRQSIPTFTETVALLMKPENRHVTFNVDVKIFNDPERLFKLMHTIISAQPEWETVLAPRILLGLWHTKFVKYAETILPYCRRSHIGFDALATWEGAKFREECKQAGKKIMAWTVNEPAYMVEAVRWGVDVILTDVTKTWLDLRAALRADFDKVAAQYGRMFLWTTPWFYSPFQLFRRNLVRYYLQMHAGPLQKLSGLDALRPRRSLLR